MSNVMMFPLKGRGLAGPAPGSDELLRDMLAIANYLDAVAPRTAHPLWLRAIASELRRTARQAAPG